MDSQKNVYETLFRYTKALLSALGYRDLLTKLHSDRVYGLAATIGSRLGLDDDELSALKISASFHDIGKIGIPDHILLKSERFDESEWAVMQQHSSIGEKIMLATELEGAEMAAFAILHHHEHYDGSGYPDGLSADEIPVCSRIISIADSYDAMSVTRSYHSARKHTEIMKILHDETGKKHDPYVMHVFCATIEGSQYKVA